MVRLFSSPRLILHVVMMAGCLAAAPIARAAESTLVAPCSVTISSPSKGETVTQSGTVSGKATIPEGKSLWLFARPNGFDGWWPQGGGAVSITDGSWEATIFYGSPQDIGSTFEVVAQAVDAKTSDALSQWFATANAIHSFPPIRLPRPVTGCPTAKVSVRRTS